MSFEVVYMQILCFGVLVLAANFGGKLTRRLHIGEVVGQVLGGLIIGPVLLLFLGNKIPAYKTALESLHFFTFAFLCLIVFGIGGEHSIARLKRVGKDALIICFVQAFATWFCVTVTFFLLGFKPIVALIIGSIGIATAPATTFVIMNKLGIAGKMRDTLGSIVILDDVIEVIIFSIIVQAALLLQKGSEMSWTSLSFPVIREVGLALLLGFAIFIALRLTISRRWLVPKEERGRTGTFLGSEFLSRLISELPGPSVDVFVIAWGFVTLGVGLALHWNLPFLITAVSAGIFVSNFYSHQVFKSLRIENATSVFTLMFFALIGANANIEAFHPKNFLFIGCYVAARTLGKMGGTWVGCMMTHQNKRLKHILPKLMLPQAGVAAIEAFFIAAVLGGDGQMILGIILPGLIIFEIIGVITSERALLKWRSWATGGGELIGEEDKIRDLVEKERLSMNKLIRPECLKVPLDVNSKGEAIWELIRMLQSVGFVHNAGKVLEIILQRERQGGTTLGEGVAILHGRIPGLREPAVALGVLAKDHGIDFGGQEDTSVDIIYMVLSPADKPELHLQVLATIAKFLLDSDVRMLLRYAKNEQEAMKIIEEHSKE